MDFLVNIEQFDGPLDLLLHLIKENKLDLMDLDMDVLASQYIAYIHAMQNIHLVVASEYLVELASMVEYKSRKLLPREDVQIEESYEEDTREKLVERLIEYQRYKEVSNTLKLEYENRLQQFTRPVASVVDEWKVPIELNEMEEQSPYELMKAMNRVLNRMKIVKPYETKITVKEISLQDRLQQVKDKFKDRKDPIAFEEVYQDCPTKHVVIVTFLSILDLIHQKWMTFTIDENQNIWLYVFDNHPDFTFETDIDDTIDSKIINEDSVVMLDESEESENIEFEVEMNSDIINEILESTEDLSFEENTIDEEGLLEESEEITSIEVSKMDALEQEEECKAIEMDTSDDSKELEEINVIEESIENIDEPTSKENRVDKETILEDSEETTRIETIEMDAFEQTEEPMFEDSKAVETDSLDDSDELVETMEENTSKKEEPLFESENKEEDIFRNLFEKDYSMWIFIGILLTCGLLLIYLLWPRKKKKEEKKKEQKEKQKKKKNPILKKNRKKEIQKKLSKINEALITFNNTHE